jgi:phage terminase small subunit
VKLNARQQKFVDVYAGNGTDAARKAGYKGTENTLAQCARGLLRNSHIAAAIKARETKEVRPLIADRQARQSFWTEVMKDPDADMKDRLKASELLGKSEADFTENHNHKGAVSIGVVDPYAEKPR